MRQIPNLKMGIPKFKIPNSQIQKMGIPKLKMRILSQIPNLKMGIPKFKMGMCLKLSQIRPKLRQFGNLKMGIGKMGI